MFALAILIGIYSYSVFFLGLLYKLTIPNITFLTLLFLCINIIYYRKKRFTFSKKISIVPTSLLFLLIIQAIVNLIGALGPELAFDALWYHLTLPKIYLQNQSIFFIPNGLFYYSAMPKLGEMLYIAAIGLQSEILAKLIHFFFGILVCIVIYKFSRKYVNQTFSLIAVVIFYSNLVVGWESITAYIDLVRTFFEIMALWQFSKWIDDHKDTTLFGVGIMLGLAITTKILAIGSLAIFCLLVIFTLYKQKTKITNLITKIAIVIVPSLVIPLSWFIFSYVNTNNIVYPFFTSLYPTALSLSLLNPIIFFHDTLILFTRSADPISPVYIALLPLLLIQLKKQKTNIQYLMLYCLLSLIVWYITPQTGGGRFILPYLPAYSFLAAMIISQQKSILKPILIGFVIIISMISISYRFIANAKYIPVIFGKESKQTFLTQHLNFSFGDFYDTDGYFAKYIKPTDRVLLLGFHNLYYVDFPFELNTDKHNFNYIATQHTALPHSFANWHAIYHNAKTGVTLYKK